MKFYSLVSSDFLGFRCKELIYSNVPEYRQLKNYSNIIVEHTATLNTLQKVLKERQKKGSKTIGLHLMIGKNGQIYITRPLDKQGNFSNEKLNTNSIGIGVFGNLNRYPPTEKQIQTLKEFIPVLKEKYGVSNVETHNLAVYRILKKEATVPFPEYRDETFESDFSYYSFLKEISKAIQLQNDDNMKEIFNTMNSPHEIYLHKELKKLKL